MSLLLEYSSSIQAMENQGRVSPVAVLVQGNMLLVSGGYAGYVRGDLIAFKFPPHIAPPQVRRVTTCIYV